MIKFDFIGHKKIFFSISLTLIAIILAVTLCFGIELDIQFKGGAIIKYTYTGEVSESEFAAKAEELLGQKINTQMAKDLGGGKNSVVITLAGEKGLSVDDQEKLTAGLEKIYADNDMELSSVNSVEPTMGREFLMKCLMAVAFASLLIVIYVAIRFRKIGGLSAGVMAVVALIHDVIMVFGVFAILRIPLNDNFMAVAITIIGYSVNDTIVIYDRIRENERLYGNKMQIAELVNTSICQSFRRSLNTSVTTVLAMSCVAVVAVFFGVTSIVSFAIPMLVGLICGFYSTVFIANPLYVMWQEHKEKKRRAQRA